MCLFLGPIYGSVNTAPDEFLEYYIGFVEDENGGARHNYCKSC